MNGGVVGPTNTTSAATASGVFSLVEAQLDKQASNFPQYSGVDAQFNLTTLLLHGDGSNGANNNTFLDSSTNAYTITRNGTATQGTFSPFSQTGWSNYFGGTSDWLTAPMNTAITGDFTAECWFYCTASAAAYNGIFAKRTSGATYSPFLLGLSAGGSGTSIALLLSTSGSSWAINTTFSAVTFNQWNHIALVRSGSTVTCYLNGTSVYSTTLAGTLYNPADAFSVGALAANGYGPFNGNISNARLVIGTAVYTSNFTPSTSLLTAITNTALLTCRSNCFVDNSTNAYTITPSGTPSVQSFSPFPPAAAYGVSTVGGSMWFNNTSDYLSYTDTVNGFGTGDFTIECWVYSSSVSQNILFNSTTSNNWAVIFYNQQVYWQYNGSNIFNTSSSVQLSAWNHIALVRSSSTLTIYINGVSGASTTVSTNIPTPTGSKYVGPSGGGAGGYYLSNVRIVKGTAVYTSNFTPPTSPVTAIANTQLLLNGTNSGIYDSTAKNNFLTGSTATISTTQAKFGSGSMYFDTTINASVRNDTNSSGAVTFGTGDFTVECWFYPTTNTGSFTTLITSRTVTITNSFWLGMSGLTPIYYRDAAVINSGSAVTLNNWHHIALCRSAGTSRLFVDGVSVGTPVSDTTNFTDVGIRLGYDISQSAFGFSGYIDDVRISKYARYPTNSTFTPSIIAWLNQ
jgi:hypothetical protein